MLLSILSLAAVARAYPDLVSCNQRLEVGRVWMEAAAVASERTIELVDVGANALVACGSQVAAGVVVRPRVAGMGPRDQFILEAAGADDYGIACGGARSWRAEDTFEVPGGATVTVTGAHAWRYGPVSVTEPCAVTGVGEGPAPAPRPTPDPTPADCASDRAGYDFAVALDGALTFHWALVDGRAAGGGDVRPADAPAALKAALVVAGGGDDAWVSLGWGDGEMVGTECVISERGGLPRKYELTSTDRRGVRPMPAARQTLRNAAAYEEAGVAVVEFEKWLEEPGELVVGADKFVWARGRGALANHGGRVGALRLDLATCDKKREEIDSVSARAMRAHGGLMIAAFAACMPFAIVAASARKLQPAGDATWLRAHVLFNAVALALGVAGAAVAAAAVSDGEKDHLRNRHGKAGVACLVLVGLNACAGLARPRKDASLRPAFDVGHAVAGYGAVVFAFFVTRSGISKADEYGYLDGRNWANGNLNWHVRHVAVCAASAVLWLACLGLRCRRRASIEDEVRDGHLELSTGSSKDGHPNPFDKDSPDASRKRSFC